MIILNLTQHKSTQEQVKSGVIDLSEEYKLRLGKLLTFEDIPTCEEIEERVEEIYNLIIDFCLAPLSPIKEEVKNLVINKDENGCFLVDEEGFRELGLKFMVGGALFLMPPLVAELKHLGEPIYAFSRRETVEQMNEDGSVVKRTIFKHIGFVPAC